MDSAKTLPKIENGSLQLQWKRCGKKSCRCSRGALHGPYFALCWRTEGRQKKCYVRFEELPQVLQGLKTKAVRVTALREARRGSKGQGNDHP